MDIMDRELGSRCAGVIIISGGGIQRRVSIVSIGKGVGVIIDCVYVRKMSLIFRLQTEGVRVE